MQKNFSDADIADIVKTIESYVFRNSAIGGKQANSAEVFFAKIAKSISDQVLISKADVQKLITHLAHDSFCENQQISRKSLPKCSGRLRFYCCRKAIV